MRRASEGTIWSKVRRGSQVAFLLAFVYLAMAGAAGWVVPGFYGAFLEFDPFPWLVGSVAARQITSFGAISLGIIVITAILGRVFCGWVCPLGTLLDFAAWFRKVFRGRLKSVKVPEWRFAVLAMLVGAALAGVNWAGWMDPLVLTSRAMNLGAGDPNRGMAWLLAWFPLLVVIGLVGWAHRFWCRALCPLGALLSVCGHWAVLRREISDRCAQCDRCTDSCPLGNSSIKGAAVNCLCCRGCQEACPHGAIRFAWSIPRVVGRHCAVGIKSSARLMESRRLFFAAMAAGAAAGVMVRRSESSSVLRPPGALSERRFTARCVGCGACIAACPTKGLLPLLRADRLDALFTPQLIPQIGPCLPECSACGSVCPTGAILPIGPEQKSRMKIGVAVIDPEKCLPWARYERCLVCRDACPQVYAAIELRSAASLTGFRVPSGIPYPSVKESKCTGCGICEYECPEGAIRVVPVARAMAEN